MTATVFAKDQLKAFIERIERLEEEKKTAADDIREVYAEAKGTGFDTTAIRTIIRMRKMDADERREQETVLETYMHALGMLSDLPLGKAAIEREFKNTKVTISSAGKSVETTVGTLNKVAEAVKSPAGRAALMNSIAMLKGDTSLGHADDAGIPTFLRRGHPDCITDRAS